jgi:hypothetical protein
MNPFDLDWGKFILAFWGLLLSIFAWMGKRQVGRIDKHDEEIAEINDVLLDLKHQMLNRADLRETEERIKHAMSVGFQHIAERLGDVKKTADKAHERIDGLRDK